MGMHAAYLYWAEYSDREPDSRIDRNIENPTWPEVEEAIRRLDKKTRPHVALSEQPFDPEQSVGKSDCFQIAGGNGDYWVAGTMHGFWNRRAINLDGSRLDVDLVELQSAGFQFSTYTRYVVHDLTSVIEAARQYYRNHNFSPALQWQPVNETLTETYACQLYDVLTHVGVRPDMYDIATMQELHCFVEGYRLAAKLLDEPPNETPPFRHFTEWLVRYLQRGSTSLRWWQIIQWKETDDATAIAQFARLVDRFARRLPSQVAHILPDPNKHEPSGTFRMSIRGNDGNEIDLSVRLPERLKIVHYQSDGCYLEYYFQLDHPWFHEEHFLTSELAFETARKHFGIPRNDWDNNDIAP